jgi:hypothetical protein
MLDYREYNRRQPLLIVAAGTREYREAMIRRHGEWRANEIIESGGTHLFVFPNLVLIGIQIRVIRPVSPNKTEVYLFPTLLKGVPPELNQWRLRGHESFFGPAGLGAPDDLEMFDRIQTRLHRERREPDGTIVVHVTDELTQRAIWREWKRVMTADGLADAASDASEPDREAV